ncbi:uncharacterized protein LOC131243182 isoform X2 [Magnolia sinica]|uniref:uncharacterized protein LOC131243182 isoform X2 n=1 Tax=Magnolia sinica TaxID=86752 RepID=UPI0026589CF2|nr:uncharacterized protein LOC131243182 isoform X2 [Magnolia sinica]
MAAALSIRPNHDLLYCKPWGGANHCIWPHRLTSMMSGGQWWRRKKQRCCWSVVLLPSRHRLASPLTASRADDSVPSEMSVENALKLLGVREGASFDDILRAKNLILASCEDDPDAVAQVEAAYDMLLMQSLTQRRAGKVVSSSIRYADVKPASSPGTSAMPQWLQTTVKNAPVSVESPSTSNLGLQAGVHGALMVLTFVNGASSSSNQLYSGANVPGLILATSFGASLYFLSKKNISLGLGYGQPGVRLECLSHMPGWCVRLHIEVLEKGEWAMLR